MRISKYLASCGLGSRRKCEELVTAGRVNVNGRIIDSLGFRIESGDRILVDDKPYEPKEKAYYLLNKPSGVTSTVSDMHAEKKVTELVPEEPPVWPVGRLDRETEGLIILTNDGELTQKLTHPSFSKEKEYIAKLNRPLKTSEIISIRQGVDLEDGPVAPDALEKIADNEYKIVVHEGRNRLVRRIFSHFGAEVTALRRIRIGNIKLENLESGEYRRLSDSEIKEMKNA